jgi:predicted kinase
MVDATFLGSDGRRAIEDVARDAGVPFAGVWLEASESDRLERVRRREHDPSDADAAVILQQTLEGPVSWTRINASRPADGVLHDVRGLISDAGALRRN